ncbi:WD40 repeat-like protein [Stereum hirsutum FP-91666 SS1]|uniref:WD40 repeat-like protein n=1 Tax=Stereum hirsutum (strain FP-91666) TaxID=721885 RepID=UPI000440DB4F|nr:WD40 repeat-like protein [Stereum hirsutum FP-91666 SS1]EIM87242.1 WD40 repeat-like protein [Stereum hirsutum FP-91666 SS1]
MRVKCIEIHWHDGKPIATCDFQPVPFKKARPTAGGERSFTRQTYKLATGGEDNHVRLWNVHPNMLPPSVVTESAPGDAVEARPPRVEYLATLNKHSAPVNVVRFSPNGEFIASAGDDGMIIIWSQTSSPNTGVYGSDLTPEEMQLEKEFWKPRTTFKCTSMQVYDLAWSPSGEYIISGSTDNVARVFSTIDGKCVNEIAEHNHYVQGVAWDPLNEYIATQSSDRSMHVYSVSTKHGGLDLHAVGKNSRMTTHHTRTPSSHSATPSTSRPRMFHRESSASDAESVITSVSEQLHREDTSATTPSIMAPSPSPVGIPLTPATSVASSSSMFPPPPMDKQSSSRRSSFSGSNAPSSPANFARYGRSPSPMPALPAIRTASANPSTWNLYGDESFTTFYRRLTFSPDGGLLLTPAGQFEDPSVVPGSTRSPSKSEEPTRGRKRGSQATEPVNPSSTSSVFIYSRANFARPPIAQLPGHKKASLAVKFSSVLYELRPGVFGPDVQTDTKMITVERGKEDNVTVDIGTTPSATPMTTPSHTAISLVESISPLPSPLKHSSALLAPLAVPAPTGTSGLLHTLPSPAPSASDSVSVRPFSPAVSKPPTPAPGTGSVFSLPYRMLYAVATTDTVTIYDTQQSGPVCILTNLHYREFTDMTWSPDGQCLMLSARDGYCTIVVFDEILPAHHTQQQTLQFQSIAQHHSVPLTSSASLTPATTPSVSAVSLPPSASPAISATHSLKRSEPPATPISVSGTDDEAAASGSVAGDKDNVEEPPKKKRRVVLTRVGDVGS